MSKRWALEQFMNANHWTEATLESQWLRLTREDERTALGVSENEVVFADPAHDREIQARIAEAMALHWRSMGQSLDDAKRHEDANRPWEAYHAANLLANDLRKGQVALPLGEEFHSKSEERRIKAMRMADKP